jgi:1-deoxy-D-xylulose-5-phosphate reductoisomerase
VKPIVLLGATGSIGKQTREVAQRHGWEITGLAARSASDELLQAASEFPDASVVVADAAHSGTSPLVNALGQRVTFGHDAVTEMASSREVIVVNGIVGAAGLAASLAALEAGNRLALANKETLVAGGPVVVEAARRGGGEIIPIDSEHSALWQCLVGERRGDVRRLILTASGGPFRSRSTDELRNVTVGEALNHPTWAMGPRVTIDSATLANKGLEVIEAHYLFDVDYDEIDVVVHPESIVHSMVEYADGAIIAQLGAPDMRLPIQYALTYPVRAVAPSGPFDFTSTSLTFHEPDVLTFRCLALGYAAGRTGGSAPAVLNAADEVAVAGFLDERIGFLEIADVIESTLGAMDHGPLNSLSDVLEYDTEARRVAARWIAARE